MYKIAYSYNERTIFYFDEVGNKYVAQGGNLAWRINNPGLVRSHSHFAGKNGSIGSCNGFAIFSHPTQGRKALVDLLRAKKYWSSRLKKVAKLYAPKDPEKFLQKLASAAGVDSNSKISTLSDTQFNHLLIAIEKLSGYAVIGNEKFTLLPKIYARLEGKDVTKDIYLAEGGLALSKNETVRQISEHLLDAVIVHQENGGLHLRSRPSFPTQHIHISERELTPFDGEIDTILRTVGEKRKGQCIWAFINGVWNTKEEALESANAISNIANGEQVLSMPNDTLRWDKDLAICGLLKINIDTPVIRIARKFFRHLLFLSKQSGSNVPIVIFAHSMGAIICDRALDLLESSERQKICIYTFGGGSLIAPGKCHPDSHNFASASDLICLMGSPYFRTLAMRRYWGLKEGLSQEQIIERWAQEDAILYLDSADAVDIRDFKTQRKEHLEQQLAKISNVTIVDPGSSIEHLFLNDCYQTIVKALVLKWRRTPAPRDESLNAMACVTI